MAEIGRDAIDALSLCLELCPSSSGDTCMWDSLNLWIQLDQASSVIPHSRAGSCPGETWEGLRRLVWAASALPGFQGCTAAPGVAAQPFQELSYLLSSCLLSSLSQNFLSRHCSSGTLLLPAWTPGVKVHCTVAPAWFCWESTSLPAPLGPSLAPLQL